MKIFFIILLVAAISFGLYAGYEYRLESVRATPSKLFKGNQDRVDNLKTKLAKLRSERHAIMAGE